MDKRKLALFKEYISKNEKDKASTLIVELLTWDQYTLFCDKACQYFWGKNLVPEAMAYQSAGIQAILTQQAERNKNNEEAKAIEAREIADGKALLYEDSLNSFEIVSEKAAKIITDEILSLAAKLLGENE